MSQDASVTEELSRLRASEARLIALAEGARRLLGVTDPKALVDEVLTLARQSVAADGYAVWRRQDNTWRVAATSGMDASFASIELPAERTPPFTEPVVAEDVTDTPMLESRREAYATSGVRSLVAVPLEIRGRPGGSIVYYYRERHRPQPMELKIAEALGHLAAAAISSAELHLEQQQLAGENARLLEQAQESNRSKDDFLAALSHELRTPLNAIVGWSSLLAKSPDVDLQRGLDAIHRNAKAQATLVDELLDSSRIESGKMALDFKVAAVAPIVQAAVDAAMPAVADRSITLNLANADPEVAVWGDAARLQQVFWNLLANAVKFTEAGGRIDVQVRATPSEVTVTVRDTGIGIPRDELPQVFERFRPADAVMTKRYRGLGLGLSLARQLTQMHGGKIVAASDGPGRGSTFTVGLPLFNPAAQSTEARAAAAPELLTGVRIIAVDDDPDALEIITKLLRLHGADVVAVSSAQRALDQLRRGAASLLISDIAMPDRDGFWLLEQVRRQPRDRGGDVPAIAVSAFTDVNTRMRASSAGFSAHLSKPVRADTLVSEVARVLAHHGGSVL
jgi:signal transduction histidine kinase/ActR/RegA family two-component response regulator